jgi:hypothetical protein
MWGTRGSLRRRAVIRMEFYAGAIGCTALGALVLARSSGWYLLLGIWLVGAGLNYVPLAVYAQVLSRPGALEAELEGVDVGAELRRAGREQFWIAVPGAVALAAVLRRD